jgi:hypothetical protein
MATEQMKDEIGQFFDHFRGISAYFRKQLTPPSHRPPSHALLAGKMACCALLDALSVARFPDKEVGKRFREFIKEFSEYEYWDNASIPQILYRLQCSLDPVHEPLRQYAEQRLAYKQGYAIKEDPLCSELVKQFPRSESLINACCYLPLFYRYRNALVHEMRQSGYGYEFEYNAEPCYQTQEEMPTERQTFQLTFPLRFFFDVCDKCIANLEVYFLRENRSPFDAYESRFGDTW